jgi:hypothetical protein
VTPPGHWSAFAQHVSLRDHSSFDRDIVHRWTAEGLARLEGEQATRLRAHCAGTYRWELVDETHDIDDAVESVRNFLAAQDFDAAYAPAKSCLKFFAKSNETIRLAALATGTLETFPETQDNFAWIDREPNAHRSLGLTERALSRSTQINRVLEHRAQAEPSHIDPQRNLSTKSVAGTGFEDIRARAHASILQYKVSLCQ